MNIASQSRALSVVKDRYFVASKKQLLHYGDCEIYSVDKHYCSCGLLHHLNYLDFSLAGIVYPKFGDDSYKQDHGKKPRKNKKKEAEVKKLLEDIFGKMEPPSLTDLKWDYDDYKKIINNCFTRREFPRGFNRLTYWLKSQIMNR